MPSPTTTTTVHHRTDIERNDVEGEGEEVNNTRGSGGGEEEEHQPFTRKPNAFPYSRPKRRSPCTVLRCCASLMLPAVLGIFGLSYVSMISYYYEYPIMVLVPFHVLLALSLKSYWEIVTTDPGTVPDEWHDAVAQRKTQSTYQKCGKTQKFIPLRAVYDSITGRLVLCQDHFCPWVANCVGFYNRKFFILFCFWSCFLSLFCGVLLGIKAKQMLEGTLITTTTSDRGVLMMAAVLDCTFFVCLIFFNLAHFYMAMKNQTSIEDSADSKCYDRGWRYNFSTVFGIDSKFWFLPVWGSGPLGDGVCWLLKDGSMVGLPND